MSTELIGGILFGASVGGGVAVLACAWAHRRSWERLNCHGLVHLARLCLDELTAEAHDERVALREARGALADLSRLLANRRQPVNPLPLNRKPLNP